MKVLGIDTATTSASVAVVDDQNLLAEGLACDEAGEHHLGPGAGRAKHAQTLIPLMDRVMHQAGLSLDQIAAIAVAIGPGSFTGLRIGLSAVKGLAFQGNIAVVGIPTLTAVASRVNDWENLICPILDARKKEVYAGLFYRWAQKFDRLCQDAAEAPERTIEKVSMYATGRPCLFIGDGVRAYGAMIEGALGEKAILTLGDHYPSTASAIARLGATRIATCGPDPLESLVPLYLRPSEAELQQR
ncbi:MAG: tRNA (adenosine(37)-N6)-threonylcarbamoyltransferase complex dimerization subunit type 1 TsaB [Candidatus Binatia bacterium]